MLKTVCEPKIFLLVIVVAIMGCKTHKEKESALNGLAEKQEARFAVSDTLSLAVDPRKVRGLGSVNIIDLLFEGLTRLDEHGNALPTIAEKIDVSNDFKTYTFHLRETYWSNGDPVTAHDFEYSWKTTLNRQLNAPYAYQFFVIKNAQKAHKGEVPLSEVGARCQNNRTLVVELENPTPYFLQLVSSTPFFPVNQAWTEAHPDNKIHGKVSAVSNGPFTLDKWENNGSITLKKNPYYYNKEHVHLQRLLFSTIDDYTALALFENHELDWVGSPMGTIPLDTVAILKKKKETLHTAPAAGTQFIRVNINSPYLNNILFRKALALAIDRQAIVDHIMQADQLPATSFVPPCMGLQQNRFFPLYDAQEAQKLYNQALQEMKIEEPSSLVLSYAASERMHKIAQVLQQNIKEVLGLELRLESSEAKMFFEKVNTMRYDLALGSWFADFQDPISFLTVFQYKDNGTNNTGWENAEYTKLLDASSLVSNKEKRFYLLDKAQEVLLNEMPIIPIFHFTFSYLKNSAFKKARLTELGRLELDRAYLIKE